MPYTSMQLFLNKNIITLSKFHYLCKLEFSSVKNIIIGSVQYIIIIVG